MRNLFRIAPNSEDHYLILVSQLAYSFSHPDRIIGERELLQIIQRLRLE